MCYTYDNLNRVIKRQHKGLDGVLLGEESYSYDAAGNITDAPDSSFQYDTNNRLVKFNGKNGDYDMDGNMLFSEKLHMEYDSGNRLYIVGDCIYTYNAEDVRIRSLGGYEDTTYVYNPNCKRL